MYEKITFIIFISVLFSNCSTTRVLPDDRTGIIERRKIESEIRNGETELAITSERIHSNYEDIAESGERLGKQLSELGKSIEYSTINEQEIGRILQQIRNRKFTKNEFIKLGTVKEE